MKYFISTLIIWILNWFGIYFLSTNGIAKNVSALLLVPLLASFFLFNTKEKSFCLKILKIKLALIKIFI